LSTNNDTDFSKPPVGYPKEKLFRKLLELPRPTWPLKFRVEGVPHIRLHVRAIKSIQAADVNDGLLEIEHREVRQYEGAARVISLCVYTDKGRAFTSPDQALRLSESELDQLGSEITVALQHCSPTFRRSDAQSWELALKEGAQHMSNFYESMSMYRSCDRAGMDANLVERPERYFGVPMCELTDGHLMVFSAAIATIKDGIRSVDG